MGGEIQSIFGSGLTGLADGSFTESEFNHPQGLAIKNNKVYVADTGNHAIREIDLGLMEVTTIAGDGSQGSPNTNMGQGKSISLNSPWDITCVADDLFIAMAGSHQLWRMNLTNHEIGPYAGSGQESLHDGPLATSTLAQPSGITQILTTCTSLTVRLVQSDSKPGFRGKHRDNSRTRFICFWGC
ncbi:MAG: hypothetical protein Ct9H300mP27_09710 [Chloroflexota bacterium]|nr:MAG: hypothetical protein Ct9H300mP27_09710 [Chloroflexota bacterium]